MSLRLSLVVAMTRDGLIGKGGGLPWGRIPADMRHFRELTKGRVVIAGRKTFGSIPLRPDRPMSIVSQSIADGPRLPIEDSGAAVVFASPADALRGSIDPGRPDGPACVGGATLYRAYQGLFTTAHVTVIDGEFEGDTWFPFPLFGTPEWEPVADPVELAPGVVYHKLGRVQR